MSEEQIENLIYAIKRIADSIAPVAAAGTDRHGGHIECLTEAMMSCGESLGEIADSINNLAESIREK